MVSKKSFTLLVENRNNTDFHNFLILFAQLCSYNLGHMLVDICEIWQKVLVRELSKSAYFRSASSESDNK